MPIDPTYPAERIRFMLEDCEAKAVLKYTEESIEIPEGIKVIDLGEAEVWEGALKNPELNKAHASTSIVATTINGHSVIFKTIAD